VTGSSDAARIAAGAAAAEAKGRPEVALVGAGRWGSRILRALVECGARVWVVDPSEAARSRARGEGAAGTFPGADALPRIDAAVIATPTRLHGAAVEALASKGAPIFCEKPLTDDAAEAATLARRFDGRLFILDKWRYHPAVEALAGIAAEESLAPVRSLRTRRVQPSISVYDVDAVWILAPHELSIAAEILGAVPPLADARARFASGGVVGLEADFGASPEFSFEVAVDAPRRIREIVLECRGGTARWTMDDEHSILVDGRRIAVDSEPPLTREIRALLSSLAGGPALKTGAREGAGSVARLEEARARAGITPEGRRSR
jgi:predicted dehydrogenase